MASRKAAGKKGPKKRAQRAHSNVFAMFDQDQIGEFKEAFNFVDQNRDGFIDKGCLISEMFSLWLKSPKKVVKSLSLCGYSVLFMKRTGGNK